MKRKCVSLLLITVCLAGIYPIKAHASDEIDLLALAVESAASGESYTVMVSLASVLLNRVLADEYPTSLAAVIADAGMDISSVVSSPQALRAARDALSGFDPTGGALSFGKAEADPPFLRLKAGTWCFY